MSRNNSRLMRTISELGEYDCVIKYRPGSENSAAEAMSRIVREPIKEECSRNNINNDLPDGLNLISKVEGGGDSLFISLLTCLEDPRYSNKNLELPVNHIELREELVSCLLDNAKLFRIRLEKDLVKRLHNMKRIGQLSCEHICY